MGRDSEPSLAQEKGGQNRVQGRQTLCKYQNHGIPCWASRDLGSVICKGLFSREGFGEQAMMCPVAGIETVRHLEHSDHRGVGCDVLNGAQQHCVDGCTKLDWRDFSFKPAS